ncbi:MAG: pyridoxal-5-phosphate-dependent protein subunit beta, partial [Bacteroidota bacterium]
EYLVQQGVESKIVSMLDLIGISGVANVLGAIKLSKYFELTENDIIATVLTDSMQLYGSRLEELREQHGNYTESDAVRAFHASCLHADTSTMLELNYHDRKRIHNLKYFTWIEQQKKDLQELNAQWYDPGYWTSIQELTSRIDVLIEKFNGDVASE